MIDVISIVYLLTTIHLSAYAFYHIITFWASTLKTSADKIETTDKEPKIAVIVPVYNDRSILRSIGSFLSLDYGNYIVVVVDDSDDEFIVEKLGELSDEKLHILRREGRIGFKAGALNHAIGFIKSKNINPDYVVIFDADFEVPRNFLKDAVKILEGNNRIDVLQGYQRHVRGSNTLVGSIYRCAQAGAILNLIGRTNLDLFPIFYGSCAVFRAKVLELQKFCEDSITEDFRWTAEAFLKKEDLKIVATSRIYANGSVPKSLKDIFFQQIRWSAGTVRDFIETLLPILKSGIPLRKKIDFVFQGMYFTQGVSVYVGTVCFLIASISDLNLSSAYPYLGMYLWLIGVETLLAAGAVMERYNVRKFLSLFPVMFFMIYFTGLAHVYGTIKGFVSAITKNKQSWKVTGK